MSPFLLRRWYQIPVYQHHMHIQKHRLLFTRARYVARRVHFVVYGVVVTDVRRSVVLVVVVGTTGQRAGITELVVAAVGLAVLAHLPPATTALPTPPCLSPACCP